MDSATCERPAPAASPTVEIVCRSYAGDRQRLIGNLFQTARIFVDRKQFRMALILDDESRADHEFGDLCLERGYVDRVVYEPLPPNWKTLFQGISFPPPYNRWGYDRQQWSTFYLDHYSDADVIGVVDSDSTFFSFLTRQNLFASDGRLKLHAVMPPLRRARGRMKHLESTTGSTYINDPLALGEPAPYEAMWTDRMPICFWRDSYARLRDFVAGRWGRSFDDAFVEFSRSGYSQFNILVNHALRHESDRYVGVIQDDPSHDTVSVCQNGCPNREDVIIGAINSFEIAAELSARERLALRFARNDRHHLNRFGPFVHNACAPRFAAAHYARVHEAVRALEAEDRQARVAASLEYLRGGYRQVSARNRTPLWLVLAGLGRRAKAL